MQNLFIRLAVSLTIVLDPFGEASLQTLVHGLHASRDVLVPELPWLGSHQLLERRKHPGEVSTCTVTRSSGAAELL